MTTEKNARDRTQAMPAFRRSAERNESSRHSRESGNPAGGYGSPRNRIGADLSSGGTGVSAGVAGQSGKKCCRDLFACRRRR
ncbi:hypothetical protein, partial [Telmatospirillum sp.]|uniref:hypothetical protein n=1 Tax=Telmatospirillum sp. TaxID=2079197 RepID=UPI00283F0473